ncbi:hypothetical protein L484_007275 [Morus notabilis]|uniref:F-box associated beta-propeller type 1 domain-containing protein n=2 Tax=Morus notabilis TaxID=981085 RepID=W9R7G1_9ROSA|nr:putative F-box protein At3g16210 [Morus notabilis]EXB60959.1 hypothetical protein L484_007275 [Morus notabilis]
MGSVWLSYHCNGISCMVNSSKTVILCNLELREFKVVPETTYDLCQALIGNKKFNGLKRMGFGYDIRADVYKIVIIFSWYNNTNKGYTICAEVYDLTTNSWKDIKFMEGEAFDINYGWGAENKGVYCKGFYYWLVDSNFGRRILSFDMCNEVFRILPSLPNTRYKNVEIAVWNDSLALFIWCNNLRKWSKDPMSIEIWVMEEQSGEWCNVFSIGPFEDMWAPLTFWKRDELLMVTKDGEIVSYNLGSKKLRKLDIHPDDRMHCWGFYVKSLVSVNQRRS